jgi:rhodanese-related sulfurtransferase
MPRSVDAEWVARHKEDLETVVVNVLAREAYEKEHVPGSENAPVNEDGFEERMETLVPDRAQPVVVYCASTTCDASPTAAKKLEELGYEHVYDFEAGMEGWKEAGMPVASGAA